MFRKCLLALAFVAVLNPAHSAGLDFRPDEFKQVLKSTFKSLLNIDINNLKEKLCFDDMCFVEFGDNILFRVFYDPKGRIADLSSSIDETASETENKAFLATCLVVLNMADSSIKADDAGWRVALKLASNEERVLKLKHGKLRLRAENLGNVRFCRVDRW